MTNDELPQDPEQRLLEVLLDEEFRRRATVARPAPTSHGARWLAAALVVLGLGVVLGVMQMRSGDQRAAGPAQDPEPGETPWLEDTVPLSKYSEFLAFVDEVQRVSLQLVQPSATGKALFLHNGATAVLDDAERVREFLATVPVCADGPAGFAVPPDATSRLTFELRGGKRVVGLVMFRTRPVLALSMLMPKELEAGPFLTTLNELHGKAITKHRIARGETHSLEELREVPATSKAILCRPLPPGTVARYLGRFTRLERLELAFVTTLSAGLPVAIDIPAPVRLAEFAALPLLRHLRFPGNGVTDADVEALARLPVLTSLRIDGGLGDLTAAGQRALVRRLEAIELVDVADPDAVLQAVANAGIVRRVALQCRGLRPETFASLATMPTLTAIELRGPWCNDEHLAQLAKTKIERIALQGTKVTATGLASLASIRTLRELDMRRHPLDAATAQALAKAMPQCRIRRPGEVDDPAPPVAGEAGATGK